jgi:hypothetical protein
MAVSVAGIWNVTIATPIGALAVVLELTEHTGVVEGVARGAGETSPLINPILIDNRLTWRQSVSRPMRLHLTFDVTVDGDTFHGTSKAGLLPASKVTGTRVA